MYNIFTTLLLYTHPRPYTSVNARVKSTDVITFSIRSSE